MSPSTLPKVRGLKKEPLAQEAGAVIEFSMEGRGIEAVYYSLRPEAMASPENFLRTRMSLKKNTLSISLKGGDLAQLRAGVNSYLRLLKVATETLNALVKGPEHNFRRRG